MNLIQRFELMAKGKSASIGIGLGTSEFQNLKILKASVNFLAEKSSMVYIFGNKLTISQIREKIHSKFKSNVILVESQEIEKKIFEFLSNNTIDAVIRGALSSNKFLTNLKEYLNTKKVNRLALLETVDGHQFFYGPVGIDECNTVENKIDFLENAIKLFGLLSIEPNISILSGGRRGDIGRNIVIDESIRNGDTIVTNMKEHFPKLNITHDEILIENAIDKKSNLIIAPDGISGNLIYRTLVHLGGGKAYGAIYMNMTKVIVDTSRVGELSEIEGAFLLALALA